MVGPTSDYQHTREALGARLRQLRKQAKLTGTQLADRLGWSQPKVSRYERGQRTPSEEDLVAFTTTVGAPPEVVDELLARLRAVQVAHSVWREKLRSGAAAGQREIREIEARAHLIRAWEPSVIPGLLMTDEYARLMFTDVVALYQIAYDIDEAVLARRRRQQLLDDPSRRFEFVIGEAALRYQYCPPAVMRAQVDRVRALSNLENVSIRVLPIGAALPRFVPLHGFWLFDNELVHVELVSRSVWVPEMGAAPDDVALYVQVFEQLWSSALDDKASKAVLGRVIRDWRSLED